MSKAKKSKGEGTAKTDLKPEVSPRPRAVMDPFDRLGLGELMHWPSWLGRHWPDWISSEFEAMRVERYIDDDNLVIRAELPGIDPDDIEISVDDEQLTIKAERSSETRSEEDGFRSEFRYGSFIRVLPLPAGADDDEIEASYDDGILKLTVPIEDRIERGSKKIEISRS